MDTRVDALVVNGWDGVWSSLVGGALSAVVVLLGVAAAYLLNEHSARQRDRRDSANQLALAVANLRDAAHSTKGHEGQFALYPLRHQLLISRVALGPSSHPYAVAQQFYQAAEQLRSWRRALPGSHRLEVTVDGRDVVRDYHRALDKMADEVIEYLASPLGTHRRPPSLPPMPILP